MDRISQILRKVLKEEEGRSNRYMFFSNLQQMRRQCDLLLDLDESMVEEILENGHDWAQDHIAEAKNNMDQVFDFLMNESKKDDMELSMNIDDDDMGLEHNSNHNDTTISETHKIIITAPPQPQQQLIAAPGLVGPPGPPGPSIQPQPQQQ